MTGPSARARGAVLLQILGSDAERLHPAVRRYAEGSPTGVDRCEGTFAVAGSRFRWLTLLMRPFAGPQLLVTGYERSVPFSLVNRTVRTPDGAAELHAERTFFFRRGPQTFVDVLRVGSRSGTAVSILGRAGQLQIPLVCSVTESGWLRMHSGNVRVRVGRRWLRLPRLLSVRVAVENGYNEHDQLQTIRAVVRSPLLGPVLEYRGTFTQRGPS